MAEKKAKRLPFKEFKKLKRLAENLDKDQRKHRDWCEKQSDEHEFYVDRWVPRVGYYKDDDDKRVKVDAEVTIEVRTRLDALMKKVDELNAFVDKLAERHKTFPDLIDIKTGKVKYPEEGILEATPEDEDKAAEEEPIEEAAGEPDALELGEDRTS